MPSSESRIEKEEGSFEQHEVKVTLRFLMENNLEEQALVNLHLPEMVLPNQQMDKLFLNMLSLRIK